MSNAHTSLPQVRPLLGSGFLQGLNRILPLGRKYHPLLSLWNGRTGLVGIPFANRHLVHPLAWAKSGAGLLLAGENYVPEVRLLPPLVKSLRDGWLIDVGANIGIYPLLFRNLSQLPIAAYEPQPLLFRLLELNVSHNQLRDVTCRNVACGAAPGEIPFAIGLNGEVATPEEAAKARVLQTQDVDLERAIANTHSGQDIVQVPVTTLDADLAGKRVAFLKVDCEGFEFEILRGAQRILKEQRPILFIEVHPMGLEKFGSSTQAVVEMLRPSYELEGWDFSEARFQPKWVRSFLKHRATAGRRFANLDEFLQAALTAPRPSQLYLIGRPK